MASAAVDERSAAILAGSQAIPCRYFPLDSRTPLDAGTPIVVGAYEHAQITHCPIFLLVNPMVG